MTPLDSLAALNQYGWMAVTVFVVVGFISNLVLTRGHHKEVVEQLLSRLDEVLDQNKELRSENQQLRQALAIQQAQATRATGLAASVVERGVP